MRPDCPPKGWSGLALFALVLLFVGAAVHEGRTSYVQSMLFSRIASDFRYDLREGPSNRIRFPTNGPYDERLGYSSVPALAARLDSLGFGLTHQARLTKSFVRWIDRGAYPVHPDKGSTGLRIYDGSGSTLVEERHPRYIYPHFDSIPDLVWRTLVHIESQGMLDAEQPLRNPAVEWDRLTIGLWSLARRELGMEQSVPGGSTLATQLEKYRHSSGGITRSPSEKMRQMLSASLRAYSQGPVTLEHRRQIVLAYLNSVPLAGQAGHGEVVGLGEGLWAWYGTPFSSANSVLRSSPAGSLEQLEQARVYRQVLTLLVAQRRPGYYLKRADGRRGLETLTERYLSLLEKDGVIPAWLVDYARAMGPEPLRSTTLGRATSPLPPAKGASSVRADLIKLAGARGLYELDRLDLTAVAMLDGARDSVARDVLANLGEHAFLRTEGFLEDPLLQSGDPAGVLYSVLLLERTELGNAVRVEADNFPGDMSLATSSRIELGSTAKLRTLTTYLQVIEEIYRRVEELDSDSLRDLAGPGNDRLTEWVATELLGTPNASLEHVLDVALGRVYSASPLERFLTGGSELTFSNFDARFNGEHLSVREAFRHSVNLPFIRLMQDLVGYEIAELGTSELLSIETDARRHEYLVKFARHEGSQYLSRFQRKYRDRVGPVVFTALVADRRLSSTQVAWAVRAVAPDAPLELFAELVRTYGSNPDISNEQIAALHTRTNSDGLTLSDLGYLSRVHPLELWVVAERLRRPRVTLAELRAESEEAVVDVYGWLLRTSRQHAQDVRIKTVMEIEAFQRIHARWHRLGYPFDDLAPTLGSAIGSSGDQPLALAELAATILNDGVGLPTVRVEAIRLGEGTPFETRFRRRAPAGEQLLGPEVAAALQRSLLDVVENGTGRRAEGALAAVGDGQLTLGGKTGTGDNRYLVHDARGRLLQSRIVNRTASFVFIGGDRFVGVITIYVDGPTAADYRFTSALPMQVLRVLGRRWGAFDAP